MEPLPPDVTVTPLRPDRRRRRRKAQAAQTPLWMELPILVVVALGLALLIKTFLMQAFYIPSGSMEDTLQVGDRVLVNKVVYRLRDIHRGDVIVFDGRDSFTPEIVVEPPSNPVVRGLRWVGGVFGFGPPSEHDFIKRVVGIPGDRVACCDKQGRITVNGVPLDEKDYLFPGDKPSDTPFDIEVPANRLWVMGDHRSASSDSRAHLGEPGGGTVPQEKVVGRAFVIIWPLSDWGTLSTPAGFTSSGLASGGPPPPFVLAGLAAVPVTAVRLHRRRRRRRRPASHAA